MVVSFLLNAAVELTWFTTRSVYSFGRYMIYGHEKTEYEKLEHTVNTLISHQKETDDRINQLLDIIQKTKDNSSGESEPEIKESNNKLLMENEIKEPSNNIKDDTD